MKYFRLSYRDGLYWPIDKQGLPATCTEIDQIIHSLEQIRDLMETGFTPQAIQKEEAELSSDGIAYTAEWLFDEAAQPYAFHVGKIKNWRYHSGDCVYFLTTEENRDAMLIGHTSNVHARMKAFYKVDHIHPIAVAIARTPYHKEFNGALQRFFADQQLSGKWFRATPVLEWLNKFKGMDTNGHQ